MSWIETVPYDEAEGKLKRLYERVRGPDDNVDNIMMAHSLRPHTMEGHMVLYKNVLHHSANEVPKWFLECLGVYVSQLNRSAYCVDHHYEGLSRLLEDEARSAAILEALESERFEGAFTSKEAVAFHYARILTLVPNAMQEGDFEQMRDWGWSDGETLEVNQVVAYFNYANRMVLGPGITAEGDLLGLSPGDSENPDNWQHA